VCACVLRRSVRACVLVCRECALFSFICGPVLYSDFFDFRLNLGYKICWYLVVVDVLVDFFFSPRASELFLDNSVFARISKLVCSDTVTGRRSFTLHPSTAAGLESCCKNMAPFFRTR